jgi:hypothetical protein
MDRRFSRSHSCAHGARQHTLATAQRAQKDARAAAAAVLSRLNDGKGRGVPFGFGEFVAVCVFVGHEALVN